MSRGFYAAASAMVTEMDRFSVMANNLANLNTHGYKRQQAIQHDFRRGFIERIHNQQVLLAHGENGPEQVHLPSGEVPIGQLGTGTLIQNSWSDFSDGSLEETGAPLDLALQGSGFFVVQDDKGQDYYTRQGGFQLNADGTLVNADGQQVQGLNGSLDLSGAQKIQIDAHGNVYADGQYQDSLKLVEFEHPQLLLNRGDNLYARLPEQQEILTTSSELKQGYLERSNVEVASEMVTMIAALRSYQISQKALQSEDDMTGKLINEIGRPSA